MVCMAFNGLINPGEILVWVGSKGCGGIKQQQGLGFKLEASLLLSPEGQKENTNKHIFQRIQLFLKITEEMQCQSSSYLQLQLFYQHDMT